MHVHFNTRLGSGSCWWCWCWRQNPDVCLFGAAGQRRARLLHSEVQEHLGSSVGPEAGDQVHISGPSQNFGRLRTLQPERGDPDGESRLVTLKQPEPDRKCSDGAPTAAAGAEKGGPVRGGPGPGPRGPGPSPPAVVPATASEHAPLLLLLLATPTRSQTRGERRGTVLRHLAARIT